jgi:hypothetical protein
MITRHMKSVVLIQPVALGSYSIQASSKLLQWSALMTPKFYSFAFSRPSMTAAIDKFIMTQEIRSVNVKK